MVTLTAKIIAFAGCLVALVVLELPGAFAQSSPGEVTIKTAPVIYHGNAVAPTAAPVVQAAIVAITTTPVVYHGNAPAPTTAPVATITPTVIQITTGTVIYRGP